jgi:putative spermidine/putrescine transport system permease protein
MSRSKLLKREPKKRALLSRSFVYLAYFLILIPLILLLLWSFTKRWSWPNILPESYSLRAMSDLLKMRV